MEKREMENLAANLEEKLDALVDLVAEVRCLVRDAPNHISNPADAYWLPRLEMALGSNHRFIGSLPCTMSDTVNTLWEELEDED